VGTFLHDVTSCACVSMLLVSSTLDCLQGDIGANGARILQYQRKLSSLLQERHLSKL
jgi:hypothetical protein